MSAGGRLKPLGVLGRVVVPSSVEQLVPAARAAWLESGRSTWELNRRRPWESEGERDFLDEETASFMTSTLGSFGISEYDEHAHSLLLFGNVSRHKDDLVLVDSKPAAFLHLVISGGGTLRFSGLKDKDRRDLALVPGMVFWMNPFVAHMVKDASREGLASLTATIRRPLTRL